MTLATISPMTLHNQCSSYSSKALKKDAAQKFRDLVETTCQKIATEGIDPKKLNASIALAEFNLRENDQPYSNGIEYTLRSLSSWLYDDARPLDYIRYEDAIAYVKELAVQRALRSCCWSSFATASTQLRLSLSPQTRETLKKRLLSWSNFALRSPMRTSRRSVQKLRHSVWSKKHLTLQKI
ncbi:MAG: hypothetical protein M3I19_02350 [Lancefieldella parvula]|uniref:Uncharacterized protein n=1 Tax=Lancefieldella parvula TaxID=1382 RepID=A0A9E7AE10_9ACTN|nr:MAG: hypothetical protein M3I19_02350 [Lancefieldella parvula]